MSRNLLLIAGLCCCMALSAQFHTVTPCTARYRIECAAQETTAGDRKEITKTAASTVSPADTAAMRSHWIDSYLSVSYPLREICVTSPFGVRRDPFTGRKSRHEGLDLKAAQGEDAYAMMHGSVVKVGSDKRSGNYVILRHGDFSVSYCHLSEWRVNKGDCVRPGEVVGICGNTGRSTGPHLHLTLRMGRKHVNPGIFLQFIDETRRQALGKLSGYGL